MVLVSEFKHERQNDVTFDIPRIFLIQPLIQSLIQPVKLVSEGKVLIYDSCACGCVYSCAYGDINVFTVT